MIQSQNLTLKIQNYKLIASNASLLQNPVKCYLTGDTASTSTSLSVDNNIGFVANDYILIGNLGSNVSEIRKISTVSGNNTIALVGDAIVFDHYRGTVIYKIEYNQIEFSRSTTETGTKTVLNGGNKVNIKVRDITTELLDTNTTGFGFYRFFNSTTGLFSEYSFAVDYSGNAQNSVLIIAKKGSKLTGLNIGTEFTMEEDLISYVDDGVNLIAQAGDWQFEKRYVEIPTITNEDTYDISPYNSKYPGVRKGFLNMFFGANKKLNAISYTDLQQIKLGTVKVSLTSTINPGDTSMIVTDTEELAPSGSVIIDDETISYSAVNDNTKTLSGIPSVGNGSILTTHSVGSIVLQNYAPGEPSLWTINNDNLVVDKPVQIDISGIKLKFELLTQLDPITSMQDLVKIPFYRALHDYVAYRIEQNRKRYDYADKHLANFTTKLTLAQEIYQIQTPQEYDYFTFPNERSTRTLYEFNPITTNE